MCPSYFFNIIYKAWEIKKFKLVLSGDMKQITSIENNKKYDYLKTYAINQMCSNFIELSYCEESSRYDKETLKVIMQLKTNNNINNIKFNKIVYSETNICKLNKTRININKMCDKKHKKGNK